MIFMLSMLLLAVSCVALAMCIRCYKQLELLQLYRAEREKYKSDSVKLLEFVTTDELMDELKNRPLVKTIILSWANYINYIQVFNLNKKDTILLLNNAKKQLKNHRMG